jgi:biotin-(acetyl-CoA carboxylase) ligase
MNNKTTTSLANIDTSINGTAIIEQFDYEKTISELTEEQKQHYDELTKNINVENPQTIQSYGQDVRVIGVRDGEVFNGRAVDIDPEGALLVDTAQGQRRVLAGDVSIRPQH